VVFVASFGLIAMAGATAGRFLVAWIAAWAATVAALVWLTRRPLTTDAPNPVAGTSKPSGWRTGLAFIATGWPIVLANTGYGLMQSADRVTVNLTRPIHDFAIYSLSQSTIYVPIAILAAVSRVAFSYFARTHETGRAAFYRSTTRLLTLSWMLLLPYFFIVEWVVRRFLPKYIDGLPAGRILLLSVLFLSLIQIVQLNAYSLEGRQRQFFAGSVAAVALAFATAWAGSRLLGSLTAVAWSQVLTAGVWWAGNEWFLHRRSGVPWKGVAQVVVSFAIASMLLVVVENTATSAATAALLYVAGAVPAVLVLFPDERRLMRERLWS
jgi:O-antigen/teichoic acid export membrane protein